MINKVEKLLLTRKYELGIHIKFDNENPIKGNLIIDQNSIHLKIYNTTFDFSFNYENLICEYNHNIEIELINLEYLKYSTDYYSHTKDIVYRIEKVLFKECNSKSNYKKLIIKSKDINNWIGFTKLQRTIGFEVQQRLFNQHKELFKFIDCNDFILNIFYEINTNQDTFNGTIKYTYLPYIELNFKRNLKFKEVENIYFELLDLFYLLLGFDLGVEQVNFKTEEDYYNNTYFYYKKDYETIERNSVFISLANDLFEQYRESLKLEIFQNYFQLDKYKKSFFKAFRKYKMFHYTEDRFLGYFRILENLMFNKEEKFTESYKEIYLENITLLDEDKLKEKSKLVEVLNKPIIDRKEMIKFIVFHNIVLNVLSNNYKLIVDFIDVEKIVKLRNDISHFNDYKITQNDLEKYIDYLEFLVNYVLLRLIGYSDENFINNLKFYSFSHRNF